MTNEIRVIIIEAEKEELMIIEKFQHSLEDLQAVVGGYIEAVRVDSSVTIWLNEEGKLIDLPFNFYLSNGPSPYDAVLGDVVITGTDEDGNTVGLTDHEIADIQERFIGRRHFNMF